MRVLVFGKSGQVARELAVASWPLRLDTIYLSRRECDLDRTDGAEDAILALRPQIVINAAAYTAVDQAEAEPESAVRINCVAPAAMARSCQRIGAALIHLSTDYVFDGTRREPYREDDPVAPLSVYGRTKADGEAAVRSNIERHVILRTSWVFASHGNNFVRTMLRLSIQRPEMRVVDDQHGAPTAARDIAGAIVSIVNTIADRGGVWGTFHYTSAQPTTWLGFAKAILTASGRQTRLVPITTAEYGSAARRPLYSVLDCGRIAGAYGLARPSWRQALVQVLTELQEAPQESCLP